MPDELEKMRVHIKGTNPSGYNVRYCADGVSYEKMTREELVNEAIKAILSLTDEQCQRLMEEFRKEYPKNGEVDAE